MRLSLRVFSIFLHTCRFARYSPPPACPSPSPSQTRPSTRKTVIMFRMSRAMCSGLVWHSKVKNLKLTKTRKKNDMKRIKREREGTAFLRMFAARKEKNMVAQSNAFWDKLKPVQVLSEQPKRY